MSEKSGPNPLAIVGFAEAEEDAQASGKEVESPEIELMRLELEYACEMSPGCRTKNEGVIGITKVEIRNYETGVETSLSVMSMKGTPEFKEIDPATEEEGR